MCKLISHVHTLAFSFVNIICVNCINIYSLLYSTVLCIIYVPLYYVLFLLEEIKNYYYYYYVQICSLARSFQESSTDKACIFLKCDVQFILLK